MYAISVPRRATARVIAVVAALLLSLVAAVLVAPSAQAVTDTGEGGIFIPATGRVLDTANNVGYSTPMTGGAWRTVKIAGLAGIPADGSAGAVSVVATVADMPGAGQLVGRPNAQTPNTLMTIYGGGGLGTTSNSAILALNVDGSIQVQTETKARLILDVQGYYTSSKAGTTAGGLVTVPGTRIADSRSGLGVAKAQLKSGDTATVQVSGIAGVPKGASAVVVNLIAINTTASNGFLTPFAAGSSRPQNSLNYGVGNVPTSITAQVPLSADGKMSIYNQSSTADLAIDVQGYFTANFKTGSMFTPGTGRIYDSRTGTNTIVGNGETRSIQVAGGHVPAVGTGLTAVVVTLTAVHAANSSGSATVWAEGATRPGTTSINYTPNSIRSNTITVPVSASGKISLSNLGDPTHYVLDVQGWYGSAKSPTITCDAPYAMGSWTTAIPALDTLINCSVTAAASSVSGAELVVTNSDGLTSAVPLSADGPTDVYAPITPSAGNHFVSASIMLGTQTLAAAIRYNFWLGDWTAKELLPTPPVGMAVHDGLLLRVDVADFDELPADAYVDYLVATDPQLVNTVTEPSSRRDGAMIAAGELAPGTYYWQATVSGNNPLTGVPTTKVTPVWSFTVDPAVPEAVPEPMGYGGDPDAAPRMAAANPDTAAGDNPDDWSIFLDGEELAGPDMSTMLSAPGCASGDKSTKNIRTFSRKSWSNFTGTSAYLQCGLGSYVQANARGGDWGWRHIAGKHGADWNRMITTYPQAAAGSNVTSWDGLAKAAIDRALRFSSGTTYQASSGNYSFSSIMEIRRKGALIRSYTVVVWVKGSDKTIRTAYYY